MAMQVRPASAFCNSLKANVHHVGLKRRAVNTRQSQIHRPLQGGIARWNPGAALADSFDQGAIATAREFKLQPQTLYYLIEL